LNYKTNILIQVIIFAAEEVLASGDSDRGFLLLQLMRSYLELDMYLSLTVHTDTTLEAGQKELLNFERLVHVSICVH